MSSAPAGKRNWKCPECGREVLLSITQLDPMACDDCLAKMKSGSASKSGSALPTAVTSSLGIWASLPDSTKLMAVAFGFVGGLILGGIGGFIIGSQLVPGAMTNSSEAIHRSSSHEQEESVEDRTEPPGPGYHWVRGRERKDGTRGPGHWQKDPNYKGNDEGQTSKKKKN
jgi:hypothetical protein